MRTAFATFVFLFVVVGVCFSPLGMVRLMVAIGGGFLVWLVAMAALSFAVLFCTALTVVLLPFGLLVLLPCCIAGVWESTE